MRTETENPPTTLVDFTTRGGFLEQGVETSWERLLQSELTQRRARPGLAQSRMTITGVALSVISALTLVLSRIYLLLDGAFTGGPAEPIAGLTTGIIGGIVAGLALIIAGMATQQQGRSPRLTSHHEQEGGSSGADIAA